MSIVYSRHLGESVDQFCSDSFRVCVKCMSVTVYVWLPAEIGRQAFMLLYKYACIFYQRCWVMHVVKCMACEDSIRAGD